MQIIPDYTGTSFATGVWRLLQALWAVICEKVQAIANKILYKKPLESQQKAPPLEDRVVQLSPVPVSLPVDPEVLELPAFPFPSEEEVSSSEVVTEMVCNAEAPSAQPDNSLLDSTVYVAQKSFALVKFLASTAVSGLGYVGRAVGVLSSPVESVSLTEEPQLAPIVMSASSIEEEPRQELQTAQVPSAPEAVAVSVEPALNFDDISEDQERAFGELIPTLYNHLGTFKQVKLATKKPRLESLGDSLKPLHPLVYLGYVLRRLRKEFAGIFNHSCMVGTQFRQKTIEAFTANKDKIIPHVEEFARAIGKSGLSEHLQVHARQSKWQDFITLCIL